jgi:tetratricopeptide (TPR) repeat protein
MVRPVSIFIMVIGFAMAAAAQNKESQLPENTIDCKQFKKSRPQEWVEIGTAVFDLGKITDINLTDQPVKPGSFKFGGLDLYPVLEEKCGAAGYLNKGKVDRAKGDYDGALANFNQAILLDPNYAEAFDSRGEVYASMGDYVHAIADYNEALRLDLKLESAAKHRTIAAERLASKSSPDTPAQPETKLEAAVAVPEKGTAPDVREAAFATLPEQANKDQPSAIAKDRTGNQKNQRESIACGGSGAQKCRTRRPNPEGRARSFYDDFVQIFHVRRY